jgi:transcriptional regulator with XRE-family HTH domain
MTNKPIPEHHRKRLVCLSNFLREFRLNENLTQKELSERLNLHRNSIIRAEAAKNMTLVSMFELADALDICLKDLFSDMQ